MTLDVRSEEIDLEDAEIEDERLELVVNGVSLVRTEDAARAFVVTAPPRHIGDLVRMEVVGEVIDVEYKSLTSRRTDLVVRRQKLRITDAKEV